jgi:protein-L-isoaspartate O-methyltransferase
VTLEQFQNLLGSAGQRALAEVRALRLTDALSSLAVLRKSYAAELASAAYEIDQLRRKAATKFADADRLYFTQEALEQASSTVLASYRAARFAGNRTVFDLGCGIGSDAIALARAGCRVIAIERDPVRRAMAAENTRILGLPVEVRDGDLMAVDPSEADAAFCDPARRVDGKRQIRSESYEPNPQDVIRGFPESYPLAFKLAPGIDRSDAAELGAEVEYLSLHGEMKECVVWRGPLATRRWRATMLPGGESIVADDPHPRPIVTDVQRYLFDPDPAVVRADLVGDLARQGDLTAIDDRIAWLTSDRIIESPWLTRYRVDRVLPLDRKGIAAACRELDIGRLTPLKRGMEMDTDSVTRLVTKSGLLHRMLIVTKVAGRPMAILAERE